jgi:hypothetical protein
MDFGLHREIEEKNMLKERVLNIDQAAVSAVEATNQVPARRGMEDVRVGSKTSADNERCNCHGHNVQKTF